MVSCTDQRRKREREDIGCVLGSHTDELHLTVCRYFCFSLDLQDSRWLAWLVRSSWFLSVLICMYVCGTLIISEHVHNVNLLAEKRMHRANPGTFLIFRRQHGMYVQYSSTPYHVWAQSFANQITVLTSPPINHHWPVVLSKLLCLLNASTLQTRPSMRDLIVQFLGSLATTSTMYTESILCR